MLHVVPLSMGVSWLKSHLESMEVHHVEPLVHQCPLACVLQVPKEFVPDLQDLYLLELGVT